MRDGTPIVKSVSEIVRALCLDYPRRAEAISLHSFSGRIENEFKYYNFKIYDAAAEIVGESLAEKFICEIGERAGYARSRVNLMSERSYKAYKHETVENIARRLYLIQ